MNLESMTIEQISDLIRQALAELRRRLDGEPGVTPKHGGGGGP